LSSTGILLRGIVKIRYAVLQISKWNKTVFGKYMIYNMGMTTVGRNVKNAD